MNIAHPIPATNFFAAFFLAISITGCNQSPNVGEAVARQFPGAEVRGASTARGDYVCGRLADQAQERKFYLNTRNGHVTAQGSYDFRVADYLRVCGIQPDQNELAKLQRETAIIIDSAVKARQLATDKKAREEAQDRWNNDNAEAITAMHEAAQRLQKR